MYSPIFGESHLMFRSSDIIGSNRDSRNVIGRYLKLSREILRLIGHADRTYISKRTMRGKMQFEANENRCS